MRGLSAASNWRLRGAMLAAFASLFMAELAFADTDSKEVENVSVVGMSPLGIGALTALSPFQVQVYSAADIDKDKSYSVAGFLDQHGSGISVNDAQSNPLQPDIRFRGYAASPLLGSSQGVVVYYNGVRINEVFGDTVNWDLLPASSVQEMTLVAGVNPVFGQNALGGAIVIKGKTGFSSPEGALDLSAGAFGQRAISVSQGAHGENWGGFLSVEKYDEDGWRDFSPTEARSAYASLSRHDARSELDLFFNFSDTYLKGNGAIPVGLLEADREAVFTHPDLTENQMSMANIVYSRWLSDDVKLSSNLFYRQVNTNSFNGDGTEFETCDTPNDDVLCEDDSDELARDQFDNPVSSEFNAVNNISRRQQRSWGASAQLYWNVELGELVHHITSGVDYLAGMTDFNSQVEFARLTETRSTTRSGLYDVEGFTSLRAVTRMAAWYFSDTFLLSEHFSLTAIMRYNVVDVGSKDLSDERPELTANHRYKSMNGGLGMNWVLSESLSMYAGAYQSSRAPTPVELACSHPDAPCVLPNTFLADPPLKDVLARSIEWGLRGESVRQKAALEWRVALFSTTNHDDIHFQTVGGVSSNQGFFTNIGDTRHQGLEANTALRSGKWLVDLSYTYLDARYETAFTSFSPNHPNSVNGALMVEKGNKIPSIPAHNAKVSLAYEWTEKLRSRIAVNASSGVYLRGDEANQDSKTASYTVVNASIEYRPTKRIRWSIEAKNILDEEYERFGLYGEPDEVLEDLDNESPRFLSPAEPRSVALCASYHW
jgi:iron complex outermembrane recepter protein